MMLLKALVAGILAAALFQEPAQDERAERIRLAIQWLTDDDPDLRAAARKDLLAWGREIVPKLEELLKAKGSLEIYRLVREIELGKSGPVSEIPGPMLSYDEFLQRIGRPDGTAADSYVRGRMADVYKLFKERQYQRAYDMVNALLVLEPKSRYAAELSRMRRTCDNMVTQTSMVRSRILAPHAAAAGSKVEFVLRMENQWKSGINIQFDKEIARPIVVVEITVERMDPNGSVTKATRVEEFPIEREIPIAMGAYAEKTITLDTSAEFSDDQDYIRLYNVGAWMPVVKIDRGAQGEAQKRIFFEPATVRLVPEKHMHLATDPLAKLGQAMDKGTVNEVFMSALLLTEEQKTPGVELLVTALEKAAGNLKKAREKNAGAEEQEHLVRGMSIMANILATLTNEKRGINPESWRKYADSLRSSGK